MWLNLPTTLLAPIRRPHLEHCVQLWCLTCKTDMGSLERVQRWAIEMIKALGSMPDDERLWELDLYKVEKRRFRRTFVAVLQCLKGGYRRDGDSLLTRSHKYKLLLGWFLSDKKFFSMRKWSIGIIFPRKWWIPQCRTFPRFSGNQLKECWVTLSGSCSCQERLDHMIPEVLFQPGILWLKDNAVLFTLKQTKIKFIYISWQDNSLDWTIMYIS